MSRGVSDKITYKPYNQGEQWLLPPSLDELVPQNHFVELSVKQQMNSRLKKYLPETQKAAEQADTIR